MSRTTGFTGREHTPETKAKMSASHRRRYEDPAERAKSGASMRGRKHSAETKAKMSAALRRRYEDPAAREKTGAASRGELGYWWKGTDVKYRAAHMRPRKVLLGEPCAHADETCKGRLEVAFRHDTPPEHVKTDPRGFPYSTRTEDYMSLCASHHRRYDLQEVV